MRRGSSATFKLTPDVNLNAQISRGFRLGGINDPLNTPLCTEQDLDTFSGRESWLDERVWNYEVGLKSRVFNRSGAFNVAGFYTDINDLQATVTAGSCSSRVIFNVPDARSAGVEFEFEAAPTRNFDFAISAAFMDPELSTHARLRALASWRGSRRVAGCRRSPRSSSPARRLTSGR